MATLTKNAAGNWKAIIRKTGWPTTIKTFRTRRDADDWARRTEDEMVRGIYIDRGPSERLIFDAGGFLVDLFEYVVGGQMLVAREQDLSDFHALLRRLDVVASQQVHHLLLAKRLSVHLFLHGSSIRWVFRRSLDQPVCWGEALCAELQRRRHRVGVCCAHPIYGLLPFCKTPCAL